VGASIDVSAPASTVLGEETWAFDHWSDGGSRAHAVTIADGATHLTASYDFDSATDASDTCSGSSITLPGGAWRPGRLASGSDVDWYRFTNSSARSVQIVLADLPKAASLKLYSGCSKLLATSDRTGTHSEEIVKYLAKGTYAIKVTSKGSSSDAPYQLRVRRLLSGLSVMSSSSQVDATADTLTLVGEVWNEYGSTRGPIKVTAKLYDGDGHLLATRSASTILYATTHGRAPFRITGSLPNDFAKASYSVSAPVANKTVRDVSVDTTSAGLVSGKYQVKGTIKATEGGVKYLKLALTLYDKRGTVVDVIRGTVGTTTLSKNKKTAFSAASKVAGLSIDRTKVRTFGFRP